MRSLYDEHADALWSYAVSLTGDHVVAQDVVQETLLRAWQRPEALRPERGDQRAWLFTVARRLVIDQWRARQVRPETLAEAPADHPARAPQAPSEDETDRVLDAMVVAEALTRLSAEHRAVLAQCYFAGRSVAEAAEALGVPPGTVKSRTHYAMLGLRLALREMGVER
jgi:RNA polymerase sigma-70 factor (ECF subfamily)